MRTIVRSRPYFGGEAGAGAYDALKMNKTERLNIRRAAVQKFTSAERERETRIDSHTDTHGHVSEKGKKSEGGQKGGGVGEAKEERTGKREREL